MNVNFYYHSMSFHFKRELNEAKIIIERETAHIQVKNMFDDWNRVLPVIRHKPKGVINFEADIPYLD